MDVDDAAFFALLDEHAPWQPVPLVPQLSAWSAKDELPLWQQLERATATKMDPPFFAVAWPGAQALARVLLDGTVDVRGRVVADIGCGSGLAGAAARAAGASRVIACDVDPFAVRAAVELGRRNGVAVESMRVDALADPEAVLARGAEVVLAGDIVYGERQRELFLAALDVWRERCSAVIVADSGRPFFDAHVFCLDPVGSVEVATPRALDGAAMRTVTTYLARRERRE